MEARKVELLEKRPGYDTTWKISTDMGIFRIHRDEDETLEHLTALIAQAQNPQEVIALDQHGRRKWKNEYIRLCGHGTALHRRRN